MPVPPDFDKQMQLLTRVVREEDFRFVPILHNHPDILEATIAYLTDAYPDRPTLRLLASDYEYYSLQEAISQLGKGFVFIEDFATILDDPDWAIPFNQRRDKFATFPIAMIVFLPIREQDMRTYMRAIPDLWSFRNMVLRMEVEVEIPELEIIQKILDEKAIVEIERIQGRLRGLERKEETRALRANLNKQLLERSLDIQQPELALSYLEDWRQEVEFSNPPKSDNDLLTDEIDVYLYRIMKQRVEGLIMNAENKKALDELIQYIRKFPNELEEKKDFALILHAELKRNQGYERDGLLSILEWNQIQNRVAYNILKLVKELDPTISS